MLMFGDIKYHDFLKGQLQNIKLSFGLHSQRIDMDLQQDMVIKGIWHIHLHDPKHLHSKYI
jgi:hypothetical protein